MTLGIAAAVQMPLYHAQPFFTPTNRTVLRQDLVNVTAVDINIVSFFHDYALDNIHVTYDPDPPPPTAVPEPGTIGLVDLGVLGMVRRVRRSNRP